MSAANHKPLTTEASLPMNNMHEYVESFGLYWEEAGLPRMAGRILSWLLICDPPHQTMHELTDALQASKSSISTGTRMLIQMGIIERLSMSGQRRDYYRVVPDSWSHIMEEKAKKQFTELRRLSERGLALLDGASPARRQRLEEMRDFYVYMEREYPLILDHWRAHRAASESQPARPLQPELRSSVDEDVELSHSQSGLYTEAPDFEERKPCLETIDNKKYHKL